MKATISKIKNILEQELMVDEDLTDAIEQERRKIPGDTKWSNLFEDDEDMRSVPPS